MGKFLGLRTAIYHVSDLAKAKEWYTRAFNVKPYFDEPFYVGFNIAGFELGLDPNLKGVTPGTNVVAYWGTANADHSLSDLLSLGATLHSGVQDVGDNIRVATVFDPFGNILGIIENPHFPNVL